MMNNFISFYQHIPYYLNPVAFSLGSFNVDWYSLMYLVGFLVVYGLLRYRLKREESEISNNKFQILNLKIKNEFILDLLLVSFGGMLIGGRAGYVIFYNLSYYIQNPLAIISPYDMDTHQFIGIYGMSYHGALIGALVAGLIFARIKKIDFLPLANFIVPAVPAGYFFGRIGNFLNGELYGRVTQKLWGMYFPSDPYGLLRHPSELYEAGLEGVLLFFILWKIRNVELYKENMLALYLIGYSLVRIIVEFFRQPDAQIGYLAGFLTLGQALSFLMLGCGFILILIGRRRKKMV